MSHHTEKLFAEGLAAANTAHWMNAANDPRRPKFANKRRGGICPRQPVGRNTAESVSFLAGSLFLNFIIFKVYLVLTAAYAIGAGFVLNALSPHAMGPMFILALVVWALLSVKLYRFVYGRKRPHASPRSRRDLEVIDGRYVVRAEPGKVLPPLPSPSPVSLTRASGPRLVLPPRS